MLLLLIVMVKTLLVNGFSTFPIKGNPVFSNGPKILPIVLSLPNCPILCNWVNDNFILAVEPFAKALQSFRPCVLLNTSLCIKLFSSLKLPTTFEEIFVVTLGQDFILGFNLLSCKLAYFTVNVLYWVILYPRKNKIRILLQFLVKNLNQFLLVLQS